MYRAGASNKLAPKQHKHAETINAGSTQRLKQKVSTACNRSFCHPNIIFACRVFISVNILISTWLKIVYTGGKFTFTKSFSCISQDNQIDECTGNGKIYTLLRLKCFNPMRTRVESQQFILI